MTTKQFIKRALIISGSVLGILVITLCVHIYIVTRPKAPDPNAVAMARIDIKQPICQDDANRISTWLYQQTGIDHVLVNPNTDIAVFTYYPVKTTADQIVNNFKSQFSYKAERFMPTTADLKNGCPVSGKSFTYKVYNFFKHIF